MSSNSPYPVPDAHVKSLASDPIINTIENGIKRDIRVALDNQCWRGALILACAAIDSMAQLSKPEKGHHPVGATFIKWCDRYVHIEGAKVPLAGIDIYGARCGMLHMYSAESDQLAKGAKKLGWFMGHRNHPPIFMNKSVSTKDVYVSLERFCEAVLRGIDTFMIDTFADPTKARVVDARLQKMMGIATFTVGQPPV